MTFGARRRMLPGGWYIPLTGTRLTPLFPSSVSLIPFTSDMPKNSAVKESEVDVLIIGAGPAGVMAALALARNGVNLRIVDQRPNKVPAGQADGIQPRTIEVLQSYGLAERLLKEGNQMHIAAFYNPGPNGDIELTDRVPDVTAPTARYPFEITLHQGAIEAIFMDAMAEMGVKVDRPVAPTSIQISKDEAILSDPKAHAVEVVLINDEGTEVVHAKFVIGADGAHSWVRKTLDIAMEGEQTDYIWGVVDLTPDTDFPDIRNKTVVHSNNGSCMVIPREGDKVRLYIQLDDRQNNFVTSDKRIDKDKVRPQQILEVARKSFNPYSIKMTDEFDWWTIYIIGQRVASQFSVHERVFIAGDACHTHSPKAGQGMNASMNDSHNLAWKLTHVLRGWADISLLKTYEFERKTYAQDLINFDKNFAKLFSGKPRTEDFQDGVSHEEFLRIFQTFGGFTSGIGIRYAESLITNTSHQSLAAKLIIGQRLLPQIFLRAADSRPFHIQDLLPSDGRFKLLIFTGNTADATCRKKIVDVAKELDSMLSRFTTGKISLLFDILAISSATKAAVRYNDLPKMFRSHWSKFVFPLNVNIQPLISEYIRVLIDDTDVRGAQGGDGYRNYGIGPDGAAVVIRPDGYVSMVAPLDAINELDIYFRAFIKTP
ncbi:unnamed protein product [Cyclocybe aegerita]|uniref:Phenol 2-monooxygenase n=1 Tax=Cyclocybe aegerita TaxID=1973307 RepID=A0A8S0WL73_CYCAE|nr:unnamed protein product [Cyclocybe aegerita]